MIKKIYSDLGSYFQQDEHVRNINKELFSTININLKLLCMSHPNLSDNDSQKYKIVKADLSCDYDAKSQKEYSRIKEFIDDLNCRIETTSNFYDRQTWTVFYLLKEIITELEKIGFCYFRGQQQDWETKPGIFRNLKKDEREYYKDFEKIYEEIVHEYPEDIKYVGFGDSEERISDRANQLSVLQHYGFSTSLLDITENPFVALQFMFDMSEDIYRPQFQAYLIDKNIHEEKSIVSFVHKKSINKRIRAQKGAFLNYDKLYKFVSTEYSEMVFSGDYSKLTRVVISIDIDLQKSVDFFTSQLSRINNPDYNNIKFEMDLGEIITKLLSKGADVDYEALFATLFGENFGKDINPAIDISEEDFLEILKKGKVTIDGVVYSGDGKLIEDLNGSFGNKDFDRKSINGLIEEFRKVIETAEEKKFLEPIYKSIQKEVFEKLREFNYKESDLFPDFADYLRYKRKEYRSEDSGEQYSFSDND